MFLCGEPRHWRTNCFSDVFWSGLLLNFLLVHKFKWQFLQSWCFRRFASRLANYALVFPFWEQLHIVPTSLSKIVHCDQSSLRTRCAGRQREAGVHCQDVRPDCFHVSVMSRCGSAIASLLNAWTREESSLETILHVFFTCVVFGPAPEGNWKSATLGFMLSCSLCLFSLDLLANRMVLKLDASLCNSSPLQLRFEPNYPFFFKCTKWKGQPDSRKE